MGQRSAKANETQRTVGGNPSRPSNDGKASQKREDKLNCAGEDHAETLMGL